MTLDGFFIFADKKISEYLPSGFDDCCWLLVVKCELVYGVGWYNYFLFGSWFMLLKCVVAHSLLFITIIELSKLCTVGNEILLIHKDSSTWTIWKENGHQSINLKISWKYLSVNILKQFGWRVKLNVRVAKSTTKSCIGKRFWLKLLKYYLNYIRIPSNPRVLFDVVSIICCTLPEYLKELANAESSTTVRLIEPPF